MTKMNDCNYCEEVARWDVDDGAFSCYWHLPLLLHDLLDGRQTAEMVVSFLPTPEESE